MMPWTLLKVLRTLWAKLLPMQPLKLVKPPMLLVKLSTLRLLMPRTLPARQ